MFRTDKTIERELFAFTPRDLIPENSDVYLYIDLFEQLDLAAFYADYSSQGQESVDPQLMLRTIFYGLTHGIATGRKLESACAFDNRYVVLCGANRPCYRTFSRFLKRHQSRIEAMFVQIVRLAQTLGLASLGQVAIDGTRIKGHTSNHRTMKAEKFDRAVVAIKAELELLKQDLEKKNHGSTTEDSVSIPKEIQNRESRLLKIKQAKERLEKEAADRERNVNPKTQVSLNDPDARSLGSKKERFIMGYNCQAVADADHQIILAAEICDNTNDSVALPQVVDQTIANCQKVPTQLLADAGYTSIPNLEKLEKVGCEPIVSFRKEDEKTRLEFIVPSSDGKTYSCLAGIRLEGKPSKKKPDDSFRISIPIESCESCPLAAQCYLYKSGKKSLSVPVQSNRNILLRHLIRTRTDEFKISYKRRKAIIEPIFANVKIQKRLMLYQIGRANASAWWKMICMAMNIEKIVQFKGYSEALPA